jgi:hypothetical protein
MQNLESIVQKIAEIPLEDPEPPSLLTPLINFFLIICLDSPYELPYKTWNFKILSDCPYKLSFKIWNL